MRRLGVVSIITTLIMLPGGAIAHSGDAVDTYIIHMSENGFEPQQIIIPLGESVVFENTGLEDHWPASDDHPTHEEYADLDPKHPIIPGDSWKFTFKQKGTWNVHDHLYPDFSGSIRVKVFNNVSTNDKGFVTDINEKLRNTLNEFLSWVHKTFRRTDDTRPLTRYRDPLFYDSEALLQQYEHTCDNNDFNCYSTILTQITDLYGPAAAIGILTHFQDNNVFDVSVDIHQLSHRIGRQTAKSYGINGQSFLLCPMVELVGGCLHGYFEYALGRTPSHTETALKICSSFGANNYYSGTCYHGVGHGLMMALSYRINDSLLICDTLSNVANRDACYTGVFMEHTLGGPFGNALIKESYDNPDPLAPCNEFSEKYRPSCYMFHIKRLMGVTHNSIESAARFCLHTFNENEITHCMRGISQFIANPKSQIEISEYRSAYPREINAWRLCKHFPADYITQCVKDYAYTTVLLNTTRLDNVQKFCEVVDLSMRDSCYNSVCAAAEDVLLITGKIDTICK